MDVIEKLKYITLLWIRWEDRKSVTSWDVYKNLFLDVIRYIQLIIFVILYVCVCARKYMCVSLCVLYITWPGNSQTMGMAVMLDEIINYVHSLKNQVEVIKLKIKRRCNHDDAVVLMFKSLAINFFFFSLFSLKFSFFPWSLRLHVLPITWSWKLELLKKHRYYINRMTYLLQHFIWPVYVELTVKTKLFGCLFCFKNNVKVLQSEKCTT